MGNQLATTPSVRIADISSTLHLIAPLGGENRNFFSTFHCLDRSEADSLSLKLLVRCNRPELNRIQNICSRTANTCHNNFNDAYHYLEGGATGASAGPQLPAAENFFPSGGLKVSLSNYTQFLLRRIRKGEGKVINKEGDRKVLGDPSNMEISELCELYRSGTWTLYSSIPGSAAVNPLSGVRQQTVSSAIMGEPASPSPKTARVCDVVVKVFVRNWNDHNQALALKSISRLLHSMAEHIAAVDATLAQTSPVSVLFYDTIRSEDSDMFCLLRRPYVDFSLAERLATRPFYTLEDRLFACYQVLQSLVQLHEQYGIVHGDLKPSNVLVQSGSGWLYLADIAPFKPSRVPAHNPAVFDYYYDTDDTRCCCLAPEKFYDSKLMPGAPLASALSTASITRTLSSTNEPTMAGLSAESAPPAFSPTRQSPPPLCANENRLELDNMNVYGHTPAMDMFSAACVMVYILTDGPAFNLSEVLQLRERDTAAARRGFVAQILIDRGIQGPLLEMLLGILCELPEERPSARQVLDSFTPSVFPRSYKVLYEKILPCLLARPPDHQVQMLFGQLTDILHKCSAEQLTNESHCDKCEEDPSATGSQKSAIYRLEAQRAVHLLLPLLLHATRRTSTEEANFRGVVCLRQVALPHCKLSTQLNMVLPHLLYIVNSRAEFGVNTRIVALRAVCEIVGRVVAQLASIASSASALSQEKDAHDCRDDASSRNASAPERAEKQPLRMSTRIQQTTLLDDLILPCVCEMLESSSREEVGLLTELATRLPQLLLEARYCLEQRQTIFGAYNISNRQGTFGQQLDALCNNGWYMFQALFRLSLVPVSAAIMHQVPKLAAFLGDARTQEDLIPFLTTAISSPMKVRREVYPIAVLLHAVLQCPQIKTLHFFVEEGLRQHDAVGLKRTLDALGVVVCARKFTAWDSMTLVHQVLPLVMSPFRVVSLAARRVVEAAACTYRASEVLVYLDCAIRPLLTQAVPLANLCSFPEAVIRRGFPFAVPDAQGAPPNPHPRATVAMMQSARVNDHKQQQKPGIAVKMHCWNSPPQEFRYPTKGVPHCSTTALLKDVRSTTSAEDCSCCDILFDITLDQEAVGPPLAFRGPASADKSISHKDKDDETACVASWRGICYQPSQREHQRMRLRRCSLSCRSSTPFSALSFRSSAGPLFPAHPQLKLPPHGRDNTSGDAASSEAGMQLSPATNPAHTPSSLSSVLWVPPSPMTSAHKELRPLAVPLDTKWRHIGGIYCMESLSCGRLMTAGAHGEALFWQLQTEPALFAAASSLSPFALGSVNATLKLVSRAEPFDQSTSETYLTSCRVSSVGYDKPTGSLLVALGGASGRAHLLDATRGSVVQQWDTMASEQADTPFYIGRERNASTPNAVMAMSMLEEHVLLVATAAGTLLAFDVRSSPQQGAIWHTILDPLDGLCSALCPLYHANRVFCFVAATYGGIARLYDLRFSGLCVRRNDVVAKLQEVDPVLAEMPCPVAADEQANSSGVWNEDYLKAQRGVHGRLSILCAAVDHTGAAFAMTHRENSRLPGRASPFSASPELLFGMSNGSVSTLNLASGKVYPLLRPVSTAPTRAMLVQPAHGSLFTAGEDGYLRYWSIRQPSQSHTLCCPPTSISSEYEAVCLKQDYRRGTGDDLLPAYADEQDEQPASSGWRYYVRECPRFLASVAGSKRRAKGVTTAEPHRHHRDAILSMAAIQGVEGSSVDGDRHRQFLVSGARDGSLTVWANKFP